MVSSKRTASTNAPNQIEALARLLRSHGLRRTVARLAILKHLASMPRPQTAAEIENAVIAQGFDQSTIYRTLKSFRDAELISHRDLGDRRQRFQLNEGDEAESGPYSLCVDCGRVFELPELPLEDALPSGFQIEQVTVRGHCRNCRRRIKRKSH